MSAASKSSLSRSAAIIAATLGAVAIVALVVIGALYGDFSIKPPSNANNSQSVGDNNISSTVSEPLEYSRQEYSAPEFNFAPDSDVDYSNNLTAVYEKCSPACCTVIAPLSATSYAMGSGFVFDSENGYIATNQHVIDGSKSVTVEFYNGQSFEATVVGADEVTDIAVLKVNVKNLPEITIGDSSKLKVGQQVVAIGTPHDEGLAGTMTMGIISGIARDVELTNDSGKVVKTMTYIQTDCTINPGNSGGPLIDMGGNVIGINNLKIIGDYEGLVFAIPISNAIEVMKKLIVGEEVDGSGIAVASPQIGITVYDVDTGLEYLYMNPKCEYPQGVLIADIEFNSSAYRAGLSRYDIIVEFAGDTVTDRATLTSALAKHRAGETVTIKVFRFNRDLTNGEYHTITFKLDAAK